MTPEDRARAAHPSVPFLSSEVITHCLDQFGARFREDTDIASINLHDKETRRVVQWVLGWVLEVGCEHDGCLPADSYWLSALGAHEQVRA